MGTARYLGVDLSGLSADLVGLDPLLVFHAWDVGLQLNTVDGFGREAGLG